MTGSQLPLGTSRRCGATQLKMGVVMNVVGDGHQHEHRKERG